jgi:hypothetical protein
MASVTPRQRARLVVRVMPRAHRSTPHHAVAASRLHGRPIVESQHRSSDVAGDPRQERPGAADSAAGGSVAGEVISTEASQRDVACGMGAEVTILDRSLRELDELFDRRARALMSRGDRGGARTSSSAPCWSPAPQRRSSSRAPCSAGPRRRAVARRRRDRPVRVRPTTHADPRLRGRRHPGLLRRQHAPQLDANATLHGNHTRGKDRATRGRAERTELEHGSRDARDGAVDHRPGECAPVRRPGYSVERTRILTWRSLCSTSSRNPASTMSDSPMRSVMMPSVAMLPSLSMAMVSAKSSGV